MVCHSLTLKPLSYGENSRLKDWTVYFSFALSTFDLWLFVAAMYLFVNSIVVVRTRDVP